MSDRNRDGKREQGPTGHSEGGNRLWAGGIWGYSVPEWTKPIAREWSETWKLHAPANGAATL